MKDKKEKLKEFKLPSGKTMRYNISSFDNGKELYQSILKEARTLDLNDITELDDKLILQIVMLAGSSKVIEAAIWNCFDKVVVDNEKIDENYFEDEDNRGDYFAIQLVVAKANIMPFMKSLSAQFSVFYQSLKSDFLA